MTFNADELRLIADAVANHHLGARHHDYATLYRKVSAAIEHHGDVIDGGELEPDDVRVLIAALRCGPASSVLPDRDRDRRQQLAAHFTFLYARQQRLPA